MKKLIIMLMFLCITLFTSCSGAYDVAYTTGIDYPVLYYSRPFIYDFRPSFHFEPGFRPQIQPRFNPPVNNNFRGQSGGHRGRK